MEILRTPDQRFESIKGYPFEPHYTTITTHDGSELRIHHIDEGPKDGPILLAMHGQPVWSYLYSKMIPFLTSAGIRVVAPDLPGYGKSDKPSSREDYSYQRQVDWMGQWLTENDFSEITFFGQDWGGLIGLRMVAQDPDRFIKISAGNTGLPYNPDVPKEVINEIKDAHLLINTTPLGMKKKIQEANKSNEMPLGTEIWANLNPNTVLYDLIYTPQPTAWLALGKKYGCVTIDGLEMLIQQGAASLRLWSGLEEIPIQAMRNAAENFLLN